MKFILNNKEIDTNEKPGMVLLDFIRYSKNLKGTKIGCREGDCGACTVLVGELKNKELSYRSVTSCLMPLGNAAGKHIVTVEGINMETLSPVQQAMSDAAATQCGFCTVGIVMSLTGFCLNHSHENCNAVAAVDGNICRCTGYKSIERAANNVALLLDKKKNVNNIEYLCDNKFIPEYFKTIHGKLHSISNEVTNDTKAHTQNIMVGGGTDLYVQKHDSMTHANIDFVFENEAMNGVKVIGNICHIGASTTVSDLMVSDIINDAFPDFKKYAKLVSSTPIRNMATFGGNFSNASPIGDFTIFFLALNATLVITSGTAKREIKLAEYYNAYKTLNKSDNEYVESFYFELPTTQSKFNFEKVCKRTHLDIASVNTALHIKYDGNKITDASISAGGVFAIPKLLVAASIFLVGKQINEENILQALEIAQTEIAPISDARGTETYKRLLLSQLIKAHFMVTFPEMKLFESIEV